MNAESMTCMKLRDGSKRRGLHENIKFYTNLSSKLIKAKLGHYREYVDTNKDNPNKLAKLFDELSGKNRGNSTNSLPYNDKTLTNDTDIAEALNSYFTNITKKYLADNQQKPTPDLSCIQEFVAAKVPLIISSKSHS